MKATKKILMIASAVALLVCTVFVCVSTALVAGESTAVSEYFEFKKVTSINFEDGKKPSSIALVNAPADENSAKVHYWSDVRPGQAGVYDKQGEVSNYFYVIDYNFNPKGNDVYIQPILGVLDKIEQSPAKGFVAEFDLAFFSDLVEKDAMRTVLERVYDDDGNLVYITYTNDSGETVKEPKLQPKWTKLVDKNDDIVIADGTSAYPVQEPVYDENGCLVYEADGYTVKLKNKVDNYGKVIYYGEGDAVMCPETTPVTEIGEFDGAPTGFTVKMLNTHTQGDGSVDILTFSSDTANRTVTINVNKNLEASAPKYTFKADEWCHIAIQYVAETQESYIYAGRDTDDGGRVLIGRINATAKASNKGGELVPVYPLRFRFGCKSTSGAVGFDNLLSYQGLTVHDPDFIDKLDDEDKDGKFKYLMRILTDVNETASVRFYSYEKIKNSVINDYYENDSYKGNAAYEGEVRNLVDKYREYMAENSVLLGEIEAGVKEDNAREYANYVAKVAEVTRSLSTIGERNNKINIARSFLTSVGSNVNKQGDTYNNANKLLEQLGNELAKDEAANNFVHYMGLFNTAITYDANLARIKSHLVSASEYYKVVGVSLDAGDYSDLAPDDYQKLYEAVTVYAGDPEKGIPSAQQIVDNDNAVFNSERFIKLIDYIMIYGDDEETLEADDGTIRRLWESAFEIIRGVNGAYDETYVGFQAAYANYEKVHVYFWEKLQEEHIAVITAKLDTFNLESTSYIAKKAVCTYVDNYFKTNTVYIDLDNEELVELKARNAIYKQQLPALEGDYENLLTQNIIKFVNVVEYMEEFSDYVSVKVLLEEATEYYYSMDLVYDPDGDGVNNVDIEGAIVKFEAKRNLMSMIEEDSAMFVAGTKLLDSAETKDELYMALVECYSHIEYIDATYEGVSAAKAKYDAKYAEYSNTASQVIEHIDETTEVVCSTRGNWSFDTIISYVRDFFN